MSEWRRKASEFIPELQGQIAAAWSPMSLWIDLHLAFERAHRTGNADQVGRILKYARWCWRARSPDTVTAVMCAFFEHLPEYESMRSDIPQWFSAAEFEELREVFSYHAGAEIVSTIAQQFRHRASGV